MGKVAKSTPATPSRPARHAHRSRRCNHTARLYRIACASRISEYSRRHCSETWNHNYPRCGRARTFAVWGGRNLRVLTSGPIITAPGGYPIPMMGETNIARAVSTEREARDTVRDLIKGGAVVIKIALEPGGEAGAPWSSSHGHGRAHSADDRRPRVGHTPPSSAQRGPCDTCGHMRPMHIASLQNACFTPRPLETRMAAAAGKHR